jgi:hypothetical protein
MDPLAQCALVNFVSGTSDNFTSCENGTATVSEFSDPDLQGLVGGSASDNTSTPSTTASSSGSGTSNTATPTPTNAAAGVGPALGSLGLATMLVVMGLAL